MKTKIRTFATICILGFIGAINVNAANYKNEEEVKNTRNELGNVDSSLLLLAEKASLEGDFKVEFLLNEDLYANVDLQKEAQAVTRMIVDQEEAKAFKKLIDQGNFGNSESVEYTANEVVEADVDLQTEARLATKSVVDQEEAKVIKKLIEAGKLMEIN